jgi:hypothetical protein
MNQLPLRERVANERRRLKSVREALSAALEKGAHGDAAFIPFYVAAADYIEASMHRLHIQDVRMGEMIRAKLSAVDANSTKAMGELDQRLAGNQRHLGNLLESRDALKKQGAAMLDRFEQVSRDYTNYIIASMGHHSGSTDLAQKLFSMDDWAYMAGITEDETRREEELHDLVFKSVPKGLKLPVAAQKVE